MSWTTDTLLFAILLLLVEIHFQLPYPDGSALMVVAAGVLGVVAFLGRVVGSLSQSLRDDGQAEAEGEGRGRDV
jgi:hypothetical protein